MQAYYSEHTTSGRAEAMERSQRADQRIQDIKSLVLGDRFAEKLGLASLSAAPGLYLHQCGRDGWNGR
jgi:hypothetical protein